MKLLLKREVRVNTATKAKLASKARVASESRKTVNSKLLHLSALRAYQKKQALKLKVREISNFQFSLA